MDALSARVRRSSTMRASAGIRRAARAAVGHGGSPAAASERERRADRGHRRRVRGLRQRRSKRSSATRSPRDARAPAMRSRRTPAVSLTDDQRPRSTTSAPTLPARAPMMRLLQGDVGSGKTAVAALAMAFVADARRPGRPARADRPARPPARPDPDALLEPLGHDVTLLDRVAARRATTRGARAARRADRSRSRVAARGRVFVGTHALVQDRVAFADLRLAVVDEQHRFGVAEREASPARAGAARAADDRDAHPADAGPDRPRRPGRVRPAHAAGRADSKIAHRHPAHGRAGSPAPTAVPGACR